MRKVIVLGLGFVFAFFAGRFTVPERDNVIIRNDHLIPPPDFSFFDKLNFHTARPETVYIDTSKVETVRIAAIEKSKNALKIWTNRGYKRFSIFDLPFRVYVQDTVQVFVSRMPVVSIYTGNEFLYNPFEHTGKFFNPYLELRFSRKRWNLSIALFPEEIHGRVYVRIF